MEEKTSAARPAIELGQVTALAAPILYLFGQRYASGYFGTLGCGWAADHLSFQQTLNYALPTVMLFLFGAFTGFGLLGSKTKPRTIFWIVVGIPIGIALLMVVIGWLRHTSVTDNLFKLITIWLCILFGYYSVDAIYEFRKPVRNGLRDALFVVISSATTVYAICPFIGSIAAELHESSPNKFYPSLVEPGIFGHAKAKVLVAKVGEKFLLMEGAGASREFWLSDDLKPYSLRATDLYRR